MNGYMLVYKVDGKKVQEWFLYASQADLRATRLGLEDYDIKVATKQQRLERQGGGCSVYGSYHN